MKHILHRGRRAAAVGSLALGVAFAMTACHSVTDSLLNAPDPDLINPSDLNSPDGAIALYNGEFTRLRNATIGTTGSGGEGSWLFGGLLSDEWSTSSTFVQNDEADERSIALNNATVTQALRALARVRTSSDQAIASLTKWRPTDKAKIAEMYFHRGFAELQLGLDFCNGVPMSDAAGDSVVLGKPETNLQTFQRASATLDTAITLSNAADAASVAVNRAARVAKARTLLAIGLDQAPAAAALVSATLVPSTYSYDLTMSNTAGQNSIWSQGVSQRRYSVGDSLEGNSRTLLVKNAIPFFSAKDPRVPAVYSTSNAGKDTTKGQDGLVYVRTVPTLYGQLTAVAIANGIDARLVEAEARLVANDFAGMTTILNALRAAPPKIGDLQLTASQLPPLTAPTTRDAAINLLFREKAFWTFSRGQRLGDLRRLVREYGRSVDNVFPVGTHYRTGAPYGSDVNLPVVTDELVNPNFTGCFDRKA